MDLGIFRYRDSFIIMNGKFVKMTGDCKMHELGIQNKNS